MSEVQATEVTEVIVQDSTVALPSMEEIAAKIVEGVSPPVDDVAQVGEEPDPEAVVEAKVEEVAAPVEESKSNISRQFAALAKREKAARELQRTTEAQARDIQTTQARIQAEIEAARNAKPRSAIEALKLHGFTFNDAALAAMGQEPEKVVDPVDEKLSSFDARLKKVDEIEKRLEDELNKLNVEKAQVQERQIRNDIATVVTHHKDKYELIHINGSKGHDTVYETMTAYWAKNQELLTYEQACDMVESYFEEEGEKYIRASKFAGKVAPVSKATTPSKASSASAKSPAPTLTQRQTTSAQVAPDISAMSPDDAMAALAQKYQIIK